jgi:hypothetical protein
MAFGHVDGTEDAHFEIGGGMMHRDFCFAGVSLAGKKFSLAHPAKPARCGGAQSIFALSRDRDFSPKKEAGLIRPEKLRRNGRSRAADARFQPSNGR